MMKRFNAFRRGMTLMEMMVALGVFTMISFVVVEATLVTGRSANKVDSTSTVFSKSRIAIEKILTDIRGADQALVKYPVKSAEVFTASNAGTLILRSPKFDASGDAVANQFDVKIYRFVPQAGDDGPFVLQLHTATINGNTESAPVSRGVIAKNIGEVRLCYIATEVFYGDTWNKEFNLLSVPQADPVNFKRDVLMGGESRLDPAIVQFSGQKIIFTGKAPHWQVPIDVTYRSDPSFQVNPDGGSNTTSVLLDVKIRPKWRDRSNTDKSRDIVISAREMLMNK